MAIRWTSIAAIAALLPATPIVAQPQTTSDPDAQPQAQPQTTSPGTSTVGTSGTPDSSGAHATGPASSSSPGDSTDTGYDTAGGNDTSTSGTAGAAADTMTAASTQLQGQDAAFLRKAMEADRVEIASAQAALDQAQRSDTKNAARMIVEDHQASSQKLQSLASRKGWTLPSAAGGAGTAEADQPTSSAPDSGSFDDRFVAEQIRMHREAIELHRAQASGGSDPDLRQFARDQLPHLEHHLEMLQGSNTQK